MKKALLNRYRKVSYVGDTARDAVEESGQTVIEISDELADAISAREGNTYLSDSLEILDETPVTIIPPVRVPREVPVWRLRVVAAAAGLTDSILAVIDALPEPNKSVAKEIWNGGNTIQRDSAIAQGIISAINLTESEADDLFVQAANLPT